MKMIESVSFDTTAAFRSHFHLATPDDLFVAFQQGYLVLRSKEELLALNFQYAPRTGRIIAKGDSYSGRTYNLTTFA